MKTLCLRLSVYFTVASVAASSAMAATWTQTTAGAFTWTSNSNWTSPATFPNGIDATANMSVNLTANQSVTLNQTITLGSLTVGDTSSAANNQFGLTINPAGGNFVLHNTTGNATVTKVFVSGNFNGVNDVINAPVLLNSDAMFSNGFSNSTDSRLEFAGAISGSGNVTIGGVGLVRLSQTNTFNGTTAITTGRLQVTNALAVQNSTVVTSSSSNGLGFQTSSAFTFGGLSGSGNFSLQQGSAGTGAAIALSVGNNNADTTYSGTMGLNGTFTKIGTGILTLSGSNTYTGNTTVSAGTLRINGSTSSSSRVNVGVNGTLGGNGTIGGATTIQGTHAPGNSPGLQSFTSNLTYSGGNSTVQWELIGNTTTNTGNATYDQIIVGGNLSFANATTLSLAFNSANSTVLWSDPFWGSNQTWTLYDVTGVTTNSGNLSITPGSWQDSGGSPLGSSIRAGSSFNLEQVGNDILINYVAVPEPSTIALVVAGCVGVGLVVRRRRR
jgi:autotransporter-associated beta strand protein